MLGGTFARGLVAAFWLLVCFPAQAEESGRCGTGIAAWSPRPLSEKQALALDFIRSREVSGTLGPVVSTFDPVLKTRLYYAASAPDAEGVIPLVPADAKAVVIYFHGSGTKKASGKNLLTRMPAMIASGLAPIALDLPFHAEGPTDSQFEDINYFMDWIHKLVRRVAAAGKPIYMMGHSFGPFVIQEYAARYPKMVKGALCLSAAGNYHPALAWTYANVTMPGMRFIDENLEDYEGNEIGGRWADIVESQQTWPHRTSPETQMVFLRGSDDEWFPGNLWLPAKLGLINPFEGDVVEKWLAEKYPTARFVIKEGFGHYIFEAPGSGGGNLIAETLYELVGVEAVEGAKGDLAPARERIAALYYNSQAFRRWAQNRYHRMLSSEERAERELQGWAAVQTRAFHRALEDMPIESPEFYSRRLASWHKAIAQSTRRLKEKEYTLDPETQMLLAEYGAYLRQRSVSREPELGEDPLLPRLPPVGPTLFSARPVGKWGVVDVLRYEDLSSALERNGGLIDSVTRHENAVAGVPVLEVTYRVVPTASPLKTYVFENLDDQELLKIVRSAYVSASAALNYGTPREKWQGVLGEWKILGITKSGVLEHWALEPVKKAAMEAA